MINNLITVLPPTTLESLRGVRVVLDSLPYKVNIVSPHKKLCFEQHKSGQALVVFITGDEALDQEICKHLDQLESTPKLCIVSDNCAFKQSGIIDRCHDVITWPCSAEELDYRFNRVLGYYSMPDCSKKLGKELDKELREEFIGLNLIGKSPVFLQTLSLIQKAARHDVAVLVFGETGTGKELVARAIHCMGPRAEQPFVPVNCGALPQEIFENEVFGHEQGAYTDARTSQLGLIGEAQGGTLFLDEIDALSLKSQVVLLRFLQDHQYRPLGAQGYKKADVRIIAATNADLTELVTNGQFRADLFFRLNVLPINLPSLRDRTEDLPLLAEHLIRRFTTEYGGAERCLSAVSHCWMRLYPWPGNVRELENVLLVAFLESEDQPLLPHPPGQLEADSYYVDITGVDWDARFSDAKSIVVEAFEELYLTRILSRADGNISKAARMAGKERRALGKLVKKHGLKRDIVKRSVW